MPEKRIGSRTYRVEKMTATESVRNLVRLTKIVGPGMSKISGVFTSDKDAAGSAGLEVIGEVLMASNADELTNFIVHICEIAEFREDSGAFENVIFDLHMTDLIEAFQVTSFVLQVNYRDFFGAKLANTLKASKAA